MSKIFLPENPDDALITPVCFAILASLERDVVAASMRLLPNKIEVFLSTTFPLEMFMGITPNDRPSDTPHWKAGNYPVIENPVVPEGLPVDENGMTTKAGFMAFIQNIW